MTAKKFFSAFGEVFTRIQETQMENLSTAAGWIAEAIMADRFALMFGSGHSFIPTMDVFPRIGSFPGWVPIHELATSYITRMSGDMGLRQSLFLEKVEGYGKVVLENYALNPRDVMIAISNSGANTMAIEIAMEAKKQGLKTVGVTSLVHSKVSKSRHSSGKRLFEVVDLVLDNCVPQGDALVEVPGFPGKVASVSTIAACILMQALAAETASVLSQKNYYPPVFPSHNGSGTAEDAARVEAMADKMYAEDRRRTRNLIR
ncbi:MAG: sugar isomerase domain-containing protein [Omnitrophica WOR_2 bacterium]